MRVGATSCGSVRAALGAALAIVFLAAPEAGAQPTGGAAGDAQAAPATAIGRSIAVLGFDALGMEDDKVARLEALFRMELERLAGAATPSAREIARSLKGAPASLRNCGGESACLAAIGRRLKVELVVTGNVATLGDSHVVNIKVVDARSGQELRRIASDPLRGDPDELIEAVRVAAYRLLAPDRLEGAVGVLADISGAEVRIDGRPVGKTPLARPVGGLPLGPHRVEVNAEGHSPFVEEVEVRFQKTTRVVVHLATDPTQPIDLSGAAATRQEAPARWYSSTWFMIGAGVAAVVVGGVIGYSLAHDEVVDCSSSPGACR